MNNDIFFFFYNLAHQSNFLDGVIIFLAVYLPYLVILSAGIFLFFYRKSPPEQRFSRAGLRELFLVFFSGGLAVMLDVILKNLIQAPRPFIMLTDVQALFPETGFAFPSGHATFFMALAIAIFFLHKKAGHVFIALAFIIGLARVMAGVHFPIDILGGFALGALVAYSLKNV